MIRALESMSMKKNLSHDRRVGTGKGRGREGEWERQTGQGVSVVGTGIPSMTLCFSALLSSINKEITYSPMYRRQDGDGTSFSKQGKRLHCAICDAVGRPCCWICVCGGA